MEDSNVTACNDLDTKVNTILGIIVQDDRDTFAKRAKMYYQKRPELVEMVEELRRSYRSLAEKSDQLRSQGLQNYFQGHEELNGVRCSSLHPKFSAEDPDQEIEFDQDASNSIKTRPADEQKNIKFQRNISDCSLLMENEKLWNELRFKVSELVDDNVSQQTELIKRNENGRTSELSDEVGKKTRSRLSWLKRLFCARSMESHGS
ncbi:protein NETWORKED 3A-like [Hibiscus syriacus]|nr:protein NETWORKED 3A-like [Hibiscus syriacus]